MYVSSSNHVRTWSFLASFMMTTYLSRHRLKSEGHHTSRFEDDAVLPLHLHLPRTHFCMTHLSILPYYARLPARPTTNLIWELCGCRAYWWMHEIFATCFTCILILISFRDKGGEGRDHRCCLWLVRKALHYHCGVVHHLPLYISLFLNPLFINAAVLLSVVGTDVWSW